MPNITIDVWLYGDLARYGGAASQGSYAHLQLHVPEKTTVENLLSQLHMKTDERGFTFINGKVSAMPGIQPDMSLPLENGDRIAFFHLQSMWPFQYRDGASVTEEMSEEMRKRKDRTLRHSYKT